MKCKVCKKNKQLPSHSVCGEPFCNIFLIYGYYENGMLKLTKAGNYKLIKNEK